MISSASEAEIRVQRQITAAIAAGTAPETLLTRITRAAARLCESDLAVIALLTADGDELELAGVFGTRAVAPGTRVPLTGSLNGLVITSGRNVRSTDALRGARPVVREIPRLSGARGMLMVPLRNPHGPFGTLGVAKRVPWRFTDRDAALLTQLAGSASIAIQNAQLRARAWSHVWEPGPPALQARLTLLMDGPPAHAERWSRRPPIHASQHLPPRERQVLDLLVAGRTCKEVASTLGLSARTVEHNVERLKLRFHQPTLHALVGYAVTHVV